MPLAPLLFFIIFVEGYAVLSTELLAIRQLIPFTGEGTDTVSIIIAGVLMPLACGYYAGGNFRPGGKGLRGTVRGRLSVNLAVAAVMLSFGLSYASLFWFFETLYYYLPWYNRIFSASIYALLFLVYPIYLLGQTVPLISNYFHRRHLSAVTGRILFFSTAGSFTGSIICTLVLMALAGVHNAVIVTIGCLTLLCLLVSKRKLSWPPVAAIASLAVVFFLNSPAMMKKNDIVADNVYNLVQIEDDLLQNVRIMHLNHTDSSIVSTESDNPVFPYFEFIENYFIAPLKREGTETHDILVIGAGGFAIGRTDNKNNYTYVDIDPDLKDISEILFLKEKLGENKKFAALPARAFLQQDTNKYDLIILDIFSGPSLSPEHLVTHEFFEQVKNHLKEGGAMAGNYVASGSYQDEFSQRLDNTLRAVFPRLGRHLFRPVITGDNAQDWGNVGYYYIHRTDTAQDIYTDDLNRSFYDKPYNPAN